MKFLSMVLVAASVQSKLLKEHNIQKLPNLVEENDDTRETGPKFGGIEEFEQEQKEIFDLFIEQQERQRKVARESGNIKPHNVPGSYMKLKMTNWMRSLIHQAFFSIIILGCMASLALVAFKAWV